MDTQKIIEKMSTAAVFCLLAAILCCAGSSGNQNITILFTVFNIAAAALCIGAAINKKPTQSDDLLEAMLPFSARVVQFFLYFVGFTWATKALGEKLRSTSLHDLLVQFYDTAKSAVLGIADITSGVVKNGMENTITQNIPVTRWLIMMIVLWFAYMILLPGLKNSPMYQVIKAYLGRAFIILVVISVIAVIIYGLMEWLSPSFYHPIRSTVANHMNISLAAAVLFALVIAALPFLGKKGEQG
jgi:hypothetical protein